jgi:hypothetical protein
VTPYVKIIQNLLMRCKLFSDDCAQKCGVADNDYDYYYNNYDDNTRPSKLKKTVGLKLLICVLEITGSNLSTDTNYHTDCVM